MSIRKTIAGWIDPDGPKEAGRHWYLRLQLTDLQDWLGNEFPEIDAAIHWAKVNEANHFRGLNEPAAEPVPGKPWLHDIGAFRQHMRETYGLQRPAK